MIDYLEALLEEDREEEEGKPLYLPRQRTLRRRKGQTEDTFVRPPEQRADFEEPFREERGEDASPLPGEEPLREEGEEPDTASVSVSFRPLSGTEQAGTGTPALYEAMIRARRGARASVGTANTLTVTLPGEVSSQQPPDWTALDRAVQRDARRYDGGFSLY